MGLKNFHPAVRAWFERTFEAPTEPQRRGWPAIRSGRHTLIAAPTGSGKTLAAFLLAIDDLVRQSLDGTLEDTTQVVYVSPLKALSNDIRKNLRVPLEGIACELVECGLPPAPIRAAVRTGDTPASERAAMVRKPPHILVTTPESLYILLTSDGGRRMLAGTRTVIVDEIHAVADDKRGSHLAVSLERLRDLVGGELQRIGLSATQRPIERVARFLVGGGAGAQAADCEIIEAASRRHLDLAIEIPGSPLAAVMEGEVWEEVYDRLAELIAEHRTTLIFVNTRRMAERTAKHLSDRLAEDAVTSHHGSLSREQRLEAEMRLKEGSLAALVATASLELGIDIGAVDLVVQIGSPRSIAALVQRVGRASHQVGGVPKGRVFPTSRDDLVECIAALDAVRRGELDELIIPDEPIDILAQQIVACAAAEDWDEERLYDLVRRAYPFRDLTRERFDEVVEMLAQGFTTRRGPRGRYLHLDAVNGRIRGRKGARLTAITCGGAIPDNFEFRVLQEPQELTVGTVDEDFAIESLPGDVFQLGNTSWRILKVELGVVRVEDAQGQPPSLPFWFGEAPGRTRELSEAVSRVRTEVDSRLGPEGDIDGAVAWLTGEVGIVEEAAIAAAEYLAAGRIALGAMPSRETIVIERFFDEAGDMHLVVHSPFGTRVNRAWGLALRKVFCRTFNFELQAAASDDALILSLGPTHSFPLEDVFQYLKAGSVEDKLVQAFLDAPMFPVRWRWNAARSLAIKRFVSGRRLAPQLQRMDAEDLLAVVFPDQLACFENIQGDREIPDHPLVAQTIRDCLEEAMDFEEFDQLLRAMEAGDKRLVARDVREPSPLTHEIITARPYAFLDDAAAEERRTLAIRTRRWADPESMDDLSALDGSAIERVRSEAWPDAETLDELHDALLLHGFLTHDEARAWPELLAELTAEGRCTSVRAGDGSARLWVAAERLPWFEAAFPGRDLTAEPTVLVPARYAANPPAAHEAMREIVRGRLQALGPVTAARLAESLGGEARGVDTALLALEAEGFVFRGHFTPALDQIEWCERRLLARVHRYTLARLRAEIEPVSAADALRFLLGWQRLLPDERAEGPESLAPLLEQLEGFSAPAAAWESEILPARMLKYDPVWLDTLCLSGRVSWARLAQPHRGPRGSARSGPIRSTPIALVQRAHMETWNALSPAPGVADLAISATARAALEQLQGQGASFFVDLVRETGVLQCQMEDALAELVAWGLVTSDSFTGLRALLVPSSRRPRPGSRRRRSTAVFGMENAGRWSAGRVASAASEQRPDRAHLERLAQVLLRRYGIVFRRLLAREAGLPPWRDLVRVLRRLEARGEIRGGRFVAGFSGEQYACPDAIARLRAARKTADDTTLVSISAADPLNLVGILTPGDRVPALLDNRVLYRGGVPVAVKVGGEVCFLEEADAATRWDLQRALERRVVPPKLRAYLGRPA